MTNKATTATQTLIPAKEAARRLCMSRATLGRLVKLNRIGAYRVGGRLMFDEQILNDFIAASFQPPQREAKG